MIIGLTSFIGGGKGTLAAYLEDKGFICLSLSDVIREELKEKNLPITRENLQDMANDLRKEKGNDYLAKKLISKIKEGKDYVFESLRNPDEIKALRHLDDFNLIFIDAPEKVRFSRVKKRNRESDPLTFEEFKRIEDKEMQSSHPQSQQLLRCKQMSDFIIVNDSSFEELYEKVDVLLKRIKSFEK
jgi:dephospho-CoA kinase